MPWTEVTAVKADDTWQRLVLLDRNGAKRIRLEYQLQNFGDLRDFVSSGSRKPASATDASREATFHRTLINKAILTLFAMVFLSLGLDGLSAG